MIHRVVIAALASAAGLFALGGAASASPPQPVTISVATASTSDPFTSTGGVICATGTVSTTYAKFVGYQSGRQAQILVSKNFVCADGTFDLLLRVTLSADTGGTSGTWAVTGGTGAYRLLHGTGSITGTPTAAGIDDEYSGSLHIDQ